MSTMDRRQVLRLIGALAAAGVTGAGAACTANTADGPGMALPNGKRITVGLVAPAVGAYAKVGDEITKGFQLYLSEHDRLLGLYAVDVKVVDEGANVNDATRAVKGLFADKVLAVAGVANPLALAAIVPEAAKAKIPVLSANAAPASLGATEFVWQASSVEGEAGRAAATFARAKGSRAYVLSDGTPSAKVESGGFQSQFTALKGSIVDVSEGAGGVVGRLNDALDANPDVIFAAHNGDSAVAVLAAYRAAGTEISLVGPGSLTESIDLSKLSPLPTGVYTAMFYAPDLENPDNERFVASYHNTHGVPPSSAAAAAYDTAGLLDRALRVVEGDADPDKLNDAMGILGQINSPRGTWTFNTAASPQQTWYLRELAWTARCRPTCSTATSPCSADPALTDHPTVGAGAVPDISKSRASGGWVGAHPVPSDKSDIADRRRRERSVGNPGDREDRLAEGAAVAVGESGDRDSQPVVEAQQRAVARGHRRPWRRRTSSAARPG